MANSITLRIHPAIGISRCGNADEFILSPESSAGMKESGSNISGGLPIKPGTEADNITDKDLRDDPENRLKPQAQRFRIFAYANPPGGTYPYDGEVSEVIVGSEVDGKTIESITWQCHMANKKANSWIIPEDLASTGFDNNVGGLAHYANNQTPNVRNGAFGTDKDPIVKKPGTGTAPQEVDLSDPVRLKNLVLDSGPKLISSADGPCKRVMFDAKTPCQYLDKNGVPQSIDYPVQFPNLNFSKLYQPSGANLESMGGMETDKQGRLLVIGGRGYAAGWYPSQNKDPNSTPPDCEQAFELDSDIDNNGWFDDAGDGPVTAALHFTDGSVRLIDVPAWCICADPAYAPQVRNVVSIWDEIFNSWLRAPELNLAPDLFDTGTGTYKVTFQPGFEADVWPMFRAAHLQMFTTDLNHKAIGSHQRLSNVSAQDDPATYLNVKNFIRNPNTGVGNNLQVGAPLMPLSLGDTGASFLTVTHTQYFFLEQWFGKKYTPCESMPLSAGEQLDKNVLTNLLGGRFSPGIDLTFIVRDPYFYNLSWQDAAVGTFRVGGATLDYAGAAKERPFLGVGYTPNRGKEFTVEPGDLCKFMALPWHTDYNSCATHTPAPNPGRNTTLFWSWPAQRPVSVYTYEDYRANDNAFYGNQQFSVRGTGTTVFPGDHNDGSSLPENVGRYQERVKMVENWMNIGVVIQGPAIEGFQGDNTDLFLEVESCLSGKSDVSQPWPILTTDKVYPEEADPQKDS
jgi:hypothetical protein